LKQFGDLFKVKWKINPEVIWLSYPQINGLNPVI
jgi:hypothetical protein